MNDKKSSVPKSILALIARFEDNYDAYKAQKYNETQTRREFLDPFFKALGWDIDNEQNYAESYKDVVHEDAIKVGEATKAPDYCFRIGGTRKFFLEAKKPSVDIKVDTGPAFQLRRYAWTTKLPLSILSNFEEFIVYDCRLKPDQKDKASFARILTVKYSEYAARWSEISEVFSREAVLKGSFDKFAESNKSKKGTADVDDEFLITIETWRKELAENIALRNKALSQRELNFSVQRIIDRIIFLRICEGRGIEDYGRLRSLTNRDHIYSQLGKLFRQADDRYNSGLFHFKSEKGRHEAPDELTLNLTLDDKLLRRILNGLYYPESPYVFSALPADMLGQVYEQFLGKVIRLTGNHQAKIDDKPDVKKAGGVFYTPTYVVDYIVENTIGLLLDGKTSKQVAKFKFLDPSCGSGSFLIGAYEFLLKWHLEFYTKEEPIRWAKGNKPALTQAAGGGWKLTISERKRILIDNIYGVDIDSQAVETTMLSLLLKVLEGETSQTIQPELLYQRALPDLSNNIKCGNSIIASDFYDQQEIEFDDDARYRINVFDWEQEFKAVYASGGFDAVIGNPPWGALLSEPELSYLREKNREIIVRMIDSFMYFVYQTSKKLNSGGHFGMILPDVFLYQTDNKKLREFILDEFSINSIMNMGNVFKKVNRPTCVITFNSGTKKKQTVRVGSFQDTKGLNKALAIKDLSRYENISQEALSEIPGSLYVTSDISNYSIWKKVNSTVHVKLGDLVDEDGMQRGVSPDLKEAFLVDAQAVRENQLENQILRRVVTGGKHVKRYYIDLPDINLIYTRRETNFSEIPNVCKYIDRFKERITCKEVAQKKHSIYALHRARDERIFLKRQKLVGVVTEDEIVVALDETGIFATDGLYLFGVRDDVNIYFIMGILNSTLFVFLYRLLSMESGRGLAQVKPTVLAQLPIRVVKSEARGRSCYDSIVKSVRQRIELHSKVRSAHTPQEKVSLQRQVNANDLKINVLVYELYGLTEKEIRTVQAGA